MGCFYKSIYGLRTLVFDIDYIYYINNKMKLSPVKYLPTGQGRDSYITFDNGGFCK